MSQASVSKEPFGRTADGTPVDRYTLTNVNGMKVRLINYGATVTELWTADRQGQLADVVLGFDNLSQYETQSPYFGCIVGRVAFRIAGAQFELDGQTYHLSQNRKGGHLHGGVKGFSHCVWHAEPTADPQSPGVRLTLRSPDGDQGYPGNLDITVVYSLTPQNEMRIDCAATTDHATPINLTHHGYFNLAGAGRGTILDNVLQLDADRWIVADEPDVPSGVIAKVQGTPFDFTRPMSIGARIGQVGGKTRGYDLAYLHNQPEGRLSRIGTLLDPASGRSMDVSTNEPGVVFYCANFLDGTLRGKGGANYPQHSAVCLETGRPPDCVHYPHFPSTILRPGQTYRHTCVYRFSAS
jgi:aldose 1-epimerase